MQVEIVAVEDFQDLPYDLLLLADESAEAIAKYIFKSKVFVLRDCQTHKEMGVVALYPVGENSIEIKNIAVLTQAQSKGLGRKLLSFVKSYCTLNALKTCFVGTSDTGFAQHRFYMNNGFEMDHIRRDFFTDHYPDIIFENGLQMKHMLVFSIHIAADSYIASE